MEVATNTQAILVVNVEVELGTTSGTISLASVVATADCGETNSSALPIAKSSKTLFNL